MRITYILYYVSNYILKKICIDVSCLFLMAIYPVIKIALPTKGMIVAEERLFPKWDIIYRDGN